MFFSPLSCCVSFPFNDDLGTPPTRRPYSWKIELSAQDIQDETAFCQLVSLAWSLCSLGYLSGIKFGVTAGIAASQPCGAKTLDKLEVTGGSGQMPGLSHQSLQLLHLTCN